MKPNQTTEPDSSGSCAGSRSGLDTPETCAALTAILDRTGTLFDGNAPEELVELCRKLERERNQARDALRLEREWIHRKMESFRVLCQTILSENEPALPSAGPTNNENEK